MKYLEIEAERESAPTTWCLGSGVADEARAVLQCVLCGYRYCWLCVRACVRAREGLGDGDATGQRGCRLIDMCPGIYFEEERQLR